MHLSTFSSLSSLHLIDAGFYSTPYLKVVPVTNLSAIAPLSQWGLPQLVDYVVNYTLPASSVSIAFCALATFFLLSFIIWRCIRGCFQCCCPNCGATSCDRCCPKSLPATRYSIFTGWISITLKVIALLFSVFIMTDAIYGLATTKDSNNVKGVNLVTEAFSTLDSLMLYVSAIIASSYSVSNQLGIVANASVALTQILNASNITLGTVYGVASSAADASSKLSNTALSFNTSIVSAYYQNQNSWEDSAQQFWSIVVKIAFVLYAVVLLLTILYLASLTFNYKFGICFMTGMQGFLSALFFGLNIALSIGLMSLRDSCSQSEAIAVSLASNPTVKKLLTFYLDQSSANYFEPNEENVVLSTLLINETHIVDNIVTPINQTITQYLGQMNALTQKEISDVIATLTKSTGLILQLMGSYSSVGSLLYLLSVPVAQFNYGSTKSYLCCDVPGLIYNMYIGSTVLGWLCLVLLWIGAYFLWRMDYIAESKACCNCDCYKPINPCASEPNKGDPYNVPDEEMAPPEQMTMNSKGMITG